MNKENHKRKDDSKKDKDVRLDRHSCMCVDPNPKKAGHGGWGEAGQEAGENFATTDPRDPNYDSGGEEEVTAF
jgi:hypothetical protein